MVRGKSFAGAGLALLVLGLSAAEAKMTALFTITDFRSTQPSGSPNIESVTGYWTEGTTAGDNTSNVIVVEAGFGGTTTYTLTGPRPDRGGRSRANIFRTQLRASPSIHSDRDLFRPTCR
jgi:hypothetical protein